MEKGPTPRAVELYQKLKSLKQEDFYHINNCYKKIVDTVKLLAVTKKWGKSETKNRILPHWINTVTEIEMAKFKAFTMEEILAQIIDVEAAISRKLMHQQPNDRNFNLPNDKKMPMTK
ncbi:LOW QUALITY PROTEIN: hypothetical protein HZS_1185 [Henneguya salminicola]|nr:LOW QUALITY PROTEIN: hypothetical protein HZS_1185 [Henneguya salminicola]